MGVFNPKMLDASIRDVVSSLSNDRKTDVLLYALQHLPAGPSSRTIVENAVQSCLHIPSVYPQKVIQARLLRAKSRFSAGLRGAAHQDLQAILLMDPTHAEARALMPQAGSTRSEKSLSLPHGQPRFSPELWREIASYLPRKDLRTLLFVPHALSTIASELLFRDLHLQFGTSHYYAVNKSDEYSSDIDIWHAQRSADILARLVSDQKYASMVRVLHISAPHQSTNILTTFQIGILANVFPKLINLKSFGCTMGNEAMSSVLRILEKTHPRLPEINLKSTSDEPPVLPRLSNFNSFAYTTRRFPQGFITSLPDLFITLRSLNLEIQDGVIPAGIIAASNLTTLDLAGSFEDTAVFSEILMHGNRLEVLRLRGKLGRTCTPSIAFRGRTAPLPCLREFVFSLTSVSRDFEDSDLFGAITDFVRKHPALKALKLLIYPDVHHVGYDASVWGVLPTLTELRLLHIVIPQDLSPALSTWLIPRTVKYLSLSTSSIRNIGSMVPLWPGLPKGIKYLALSSSSPADTADVLHDSPLPDLRLLKLSSKLYTVVRAGNDVILEEWPRRRMLFYLGDWLERLECDDLPLSSF